MHGRAGGNAVKVLGWVLCLCLCWSVVLVSASWDEGERRVASAAAPERPPGEREESEKLHRTVESSRIRETDEAVGAPARPAAVVVRVWHLNAQRRAGLVLRSYGPGDLPWWEGLPDMGASLARIQVLRR